MTKQTFDLIMFTAFFGSILLAIYTNNLPESDRKDCLTLVLPILRMFNRGCFGFDIEVIDGKIEIGN